MKNTDYSLVVEKILNENSSHFEIIMRNFNPYLHKIGRTYGFTHEDTQDLMQETYMKVFQHLPKFEYRATLKSWITRIMLNNCYHKSKSQNKESDSIQWASKMSDLNDNPNNILNSELGNILENSLKQIPLEYRMVFILREKNGLSVAETAEAMDISASNVKVRLTRAKKMLKELIGKHYSKEDIYEFQIVYCDLMVKNVLAKINSLYTNQLN